MSKDEATCAVNTRVTASPTVEGRAAPAHHSTQTMMGISGRGRRAVRPNRRPGSFALWEIALVAGLVAVALKPLPRPAYIPAALLLPVVYLIARSQTRLFIVAASALVASAPWLVAGEDLDFMLGKVTIPAL